MQKDVDLHQVLWSRSRLREGQKGRELQVLIISGLVIHRCATRGYWQPALY